MRAYSVAFCCSILAAGAWCAGAEPAVELGAQDRWVTVFGGSEVTLRLEVTARRDFAGTLHWRHSGRRRTIQAGEAGVRVPAGESAILAIPLRIGDVEEGVIFQTQVDAAVSEAGKSVEVAQYSQPIVIFPRDPFAGRRAWLESLELQVFDPKGETAALLRKQQVPFARLRDLTALSAEARGLLIVGEGVSLRAHGTLAEALERRAAGGLSVLCLAPREGAVPLDARPDSIRRRGMRWEDRQVITRLDKRLDAEQWSTVRRIAARRFGLSARRDQVVAELSTREGGWPWLETSYGGRGRLLYCCFEVVEHWEAGPTPRYLFVRLLEHLAADGQANFFSSPDGREL